MNTTKTTSVKLKFLILILSAIIFAFLLIPRVYTFGSGLIDGPIPENEVGIAIKTGNAYRTIFPYFSKDGICYYFLPSYADTTTKDGASWVWNNELYDIDVTNKYDDHLSIRELKENTEYFMNVTDEVPGSNISDHITFKILKSEKLPTIYLDTENTTLEDIHEDKKRRETANMCMVDENGKTTYRGSLMYLKGHGNTTWEKFEKKPYHLKLQDPFPLLQSDYAKDWILFANGMTDESYVRNAFVYNTARDEGIPYTSQLDYVDLYIDGEYKGNYTLAEKIDTGEDQVNITDLQALNMLLNPVDYRDNDRIGSPDEAYMAIEDMINPPDITGGYLIERNTRNKYEDKISGFITDDWERFVVRSPSYASKEQVEYIRDLVCSAERAIFAHDGMDPETGKYYTDIIDIESFANKYLLEEIIFNEAQGATSAWYYKPQDAISPLLFAGPVWDYDKSLAFAGHDTDYYGNPHLYSKLNCYFENPTFWYNYLLEKEEFKDLVVSKYKEYFRDIFLENLETKLPEYAERVKKSAELDCIRWEKRNVMPLELEFIDFWLKDRISFLDGVFLEGQEYNLVKIYDGYGYYRAFHSVKKGDYLEIPDYSADGFEYEGEINYILDPATDTRYNIGDFYYPERDTVLYIE